MGTIIYVNFGKYSLKQARRFLGSGFFRKALTEWSIEELERTANASDAYMTDAHDAYTAILRFRKAREQIGGTPCPVIRLAA